MNYTYRRARRIDAPHVLLWIGIAVTAAFFMFRPAAADALLPASALVYTDNKESQQFTVDIGDQPTVTRDYWVKLRGKRTPTKVTMTGVPLQNILSAVGSQQLDPTTVPYVKIRFGSTNAYIRLIALNGGPGSTPPPMILQKGERPGRGAFPSPAIVPGQPYDDPQSRPISEAQITPFDRRKDKLSIVPMTGRIFSVRIKQGKRNKQGQIKFSATTSGEPDGALSYQWFAFDDDGKSREVGKGTSWTSDDARGSTQARFVRVIVTAAKDGSTGTASASYLSSRADDGATKDPGFGGGGGGGGQGQGQGPGNTQGPATPGSPSFPVPSTPSTPAQPFQPTPQPSTPTPPQQTPTPPPEQPQQEAPAVDASGITNIAQNISTDAPLTTVNGVLLSQPTVPPTGGSQGGSELTPGLTPLQEPVNSLADSIFQPVDSPDDLWPYLVALLFASGFAGAAREWIRP